ncbi:MAG: hypothetical protein AAB400_00690 [Patescibacteria group bacterium]
MHTLADILDNQKQILGNMKRALVENHSFISNFPAFVLQPILVVPDAIIDLYFEQAYLGCHVAAGRLPCLVPVRASLKHEHRGNSISLDFNELEMNYHMAHRCRIMEANLVQYAVEYESLRIAFAEFAQALFSAGYVKYLSRHPIEYELDSITWSNVYLGYESLLWRAGDLAECMEDCILNIPNKSIVIQATHLLERLMPYRNALNVLEHQTLGRKHGGYAIAQNGTLHLRVPQGCYGTRIFADFSDDLSTLHPSIQSLQSIGGCCAMEWKEHYVFAIPIEGVVSEIQRAINADEEMKRLTEEMDHSHWSLDGACVLQSRANPVVSRVVREVLPSIMDQRIVGFHFDFELNEFHHVTAIKWSPVMRASTWEFSKSEYVRECIHRTFDYVVIETSVHS